MPSLSHHLQVASFNRANNKIVLSPNKQISGANAPMNSLRLVQEHQALGQVANILHLNLMGGEERVLHHCAVQVTDHRLLEEEVEVFEGEGVFGGLIPIGVEVDDVGVLGHSLQEVNFVDLGGVNRLLPALRLFEDQPLIHARQGAPVGDRFYKVEVALLEAEHYLGVHFQLLGGADLA